MLKDPSGISIHNLYDHRRNVLNHTKRHSDVNRLKSSGYGHAIREPLFWEQPDSESNGKSRRLEWRSPTTQAPLELLKNEDYRDTHTTRTLLLSRLSLRLESEILLFFYRLNLSLMMRERSSDSRQVHLL